MAALSDPDSRIAALQALAIAVPLLLGLAGLGEPSDPRAFAAFRLRAVAESEARDGDPWIDVAEQGARLRPWHVAFRQARADLSEVDRARR